MKILLIGKNGQLGTEIAKQSSKRGYEMHAFSHDELDIANAKKIESKISSIKPDFFINASAYHVVPDCEIYQDQAFLINAIALKSIAEICAKMNIKFITYSTDYVFDGLKGSPNTEYERPNPRQIYGISKLAGELITLNYCPNAVIIRSSGIYGGKSGSRSKKGNFALNILQKAKQEKTIEVSSEQIVNPTYSEDLAMATYRLMGTKNVKGIYHLVNEGYCSWAKFASEILKLVGSRTRIIPVDRSAQSGGARRPLFSALKNTRAARLGIKLPTWQDAISRYISTLN